MWLMAALAVWWRHRGVVILLLLPKNVKVPDLTTAASGSTPQKALVKSGLDAVPPSRR